MLNKGILVARELKALRIRKNKTLEEVSSKIGIHLNTLSKYEKDANDLNLGLLEKLLDYYGLDELLFFNFIREFNHCNSNKL